MKNLKKHSLAAVAILATAFAAHAQPAKISADAGHPGHPISPMLWGIFFEDINLSADGGIYPELVRNRSFEDSDKPEFWKFTSAAGAQCDCAIDSTHPLNAVNHRSLRIRMGGAFTLLNEGYWGMNIAKGERYALKLA